MRCRVVVAGAGFGGIYAARTLSRHNLIDLTILDESPSHVFYPLIYQVATSVLNPEDVAFPIRTDIGGFPYDYLILSCGSKPALPQQEQWQERVCESNRRALYLAWRWSGGRKNWKD